MSLKVKINLTQKNFELTVDLTFPGQGITVIYGPSGCGKTTLLRAIAGLEDKLQGAIIFNDQVWLNETKKLAVEKRRIGYVFQEASLFNHLNVADNLNFGLKRSKIKNKVFDFEEVVKLLGLSELLQQNCQTLSGGQKQRVAIARAILSHPQILLMDEPLASLDNFSKQEILPYLEKIHQQLKLPILYVSHSEEEVARLADYLIVMQQGKVIEQGKLFDIIGSLESQFSKLDDSFGLIDCVVSQVNQSYQLAQLSFDGLKLRLPLNNLQAGQKVRVRVMARDISICLTPPLDTSILNIIPATIEDIQSDDKGLCLVVLKVASFNLIARISEYSRQQLQLKNQLSVFIQIKAMALIK